MRNDDGLLRDVEYKYSNGFIDWRAMINPDYLAVNSQWFKTYDKPTPREIKGLSDQQLVIKLGGIKQLAVIRGYKSIKCELINSNIDYLFGLNSASSTYKCSIDWIPNLENPEGCIYEDVGSVNINNARLFDLKYADAIAYNRAFARCVRNFLNINICCLDEIDKTTKREDKGSDSSSSPDIHKILEDLAVKTKFKNLAELKDWAGLNIKAEEYADLESKDALSLIGKLRKEFV